MSPPIAQGPDPVFLSVRETRLIVERILLLTGLAPGSVPAIRDAIVAGEGLGLGALVHLRDAFDSLAAMNPAKLSLRADGEGRYIADCGGEHAWSLLPSLLDLAADLGSAEKGAELHVINIREPRFLVTLPAMGLSQRMEVSVTVAESGGLLRGRAVGTDIALAGGPADDPQASVVATIAARPRMEAGSDLHMPGDPFLERMLAGSFPVARALWWGLYELSNRSLTPDSVRSRRHAGPIIVDEHGQIIGRVDDDDTDLSFLTQKVDSSTAAA